MSSAPNPYLKTKILTASPAELRLMLLDGAIRFANQAREGLAQSNFEQSFNGFSRCEAILLELLSGLDRDKAPDLCDRLSGLYTFLFNRMVEASSSRNQEMVLEVIRLLEYERETWAMAMQKLLEESSATSSLEQRPAVLAG